MPITQSVNSKANVKKFTNSDLPFAPQQPVMVSYYAVSTAGQTVINLTFSVDTLNLTDQFFLFVDGKKLRLGASNDYTFTSLNSFGVSSQVTLNQSLIANLHIQAYNLGLKKESEFGIDNRIVQLYAAQSDGFQGWVSQATLVQPTTATGTPAAGFFYSTITGRAPIVDLSQDLKPRMAVERIVLQNVQEIQGEFGPAGERVFGNINDTFNQIRFVGYWTTLVPDTAGPSVLPSQTGDYMEVTFYGTGFNLLSFVSSDARDYRVSIDGGAEGSNLFPGATGSGVLSGDNRSANQVLPAVSGLALGIHTAKIRCNNNSTARIYGFEILNESSSVKVTPGTGYIQGKQYSSSALSAFAYNAVATGVRGGRVLAYQKSDGTIGQAWQAVNGASATLAGADHTNEEMVRRYYYHEFGAGTATDFSLISGAVTNRTWTLNDGTTSLSTPSIAGILTGNNLEGISVAVSNALNFTFVGTGLDLLLVGDGSAYTGNSTIAIDGTDVVTAATNVSIFGSNRIMKVQKIVSGLPYGTHTFKLANTTDGVRPHIAAFIVYQPKKPALPAGGIELADYNVLANYDNSTGTGATTADILKIPQGVIFKSAIQETVYVGSWSKSITSFETQYRSGVSVLTTTNGDSWKHTFFGTGAVIEFFSNSGGFGAFTVAIDGVLNASGVNLSSGTITNNGGGTYTNNATASTPNKLEFTGLTLGVHTITVTKASASANNFYVSGICIITPIYSTRSTLYADVQNTLPIGNNGISDNRKVTPVKEILPITKAWVQAQGVQGTITQNTSTLIPMNDMSCVIKTTGGPVQISWGMSCFSGTTNTQVQVRVYVDGAAVWVARHCQIASTANSDIMLSDIFILPLAAGTHKVELYWSNGGSNTVSADGAERILTVREL